MVNTEKELITKIFKAQREEITEFLIYKNLASASKDPKQKDVLLKIAEEELNHYNFFKEITHTDIKPNKIKVFLYSIFIRFFGLTFGIRLMEKGEWLAQENYLNVKENYPQIDRIIQDENRHEQELIQFLNEERLYYISSVVLGLNDALVELTGALAGFTLALKNPQLIAIVGLITGIAASMSMASSEYLSTKHEESTKNPLKASFYTGSTYFVTVLLLILPYLIFDNVYISLSCVLLIAVTIIFCFTFYISVAKNLPFKKRFFEMAGISLGIAVISFFIGFIIRNVFGIEI